MTGKYLLIILTFFVGLLPATAQENEAKVLLDRIAEKFSRSNGVSIIYSIRPEGEYSHGGE